MTINSIKMLQMDQAVVKIMAGSDGNIFLGVGLLAAEDVIITCAHVIKQYKSPFTISFPQSGSPQNKYRWDCKLLLAPNFREDMALLQLKEPIPELTLSPAKFVRNDELEGSEFKAFGYPIKLDGGTTALGEIGSRQEYKWMEILGTKDYGYFIQPGFSGAGVRLISKHAFAGIVNVEYADVIKMGCYLPIESFVEKWPEELAGIIWVRGKNKTDIKKIDEAFICGRDELLSNFVDLYEKRSELVQHYYLVGKAIYSPFGAFRKIIYEKFTWKPGRGYHYVCEPDDSTNGAEMIVVKESTRMDDLVNALIYYSNASPAQNSPDQSIPGLIEFFLRNLNSKVPNYIPIYVIYPHSTVGAGRIIDLIKEFAGMFAAANKKTDVLFFWAFAYEFSVMSIFSRPESEINGRLRPAGFEQSDVNMGYKVKHPKKTFISGWIEKVRKAGAGFLNKADIDDRALLAETNTVKLETDLVGIIKKYNKRNNGIL